MMPGLYFFPSEMAMERAFVATPSFMRPNRVPYAVVLEGVLRDEECDAISENLGALEPYLVPGCGAVTREIEADPTLNPIETIARNVNERYFGFDIDPGQHSWLQTYDRGSKYQRHMDGSPGQLRKLTAVAMLSDPRKYGGGKLKLYVTPKSLVVPRTRGTIVVFQHWVEHEVEPVTDGARQTINMGFWGPPFK